MHNVQNVDNHDNDASSLRPPPSYRAAAASHASSPTTRRTSLLPQQPSHSASSRAAPAPVEHTYSLFDSRNVPWATLKLLSNVGSPRFLPAYFEGQTMHGALHLELRRPETILGINVAITGTIMAANAPDPRVFWELTRVLWNADMGDPRSSSHTQNSASDPGANTSTSKAKGKNYTKLVGSYSWPFSMTLPSTCTITFRSKQAPITLPLPPSFSEKGASQFINYEITVRIRRGPLRIDSKLGTHFGFAPRTRPTAPTLLRQLAYTENRPLVGPEGDPDGWTVLPPIVVRGKLFGVRAVEATCTLTYTRGHPVPLMLTITCSDSDTQALDIVFTPSNVSVHLIREVCYDGGGSPSSSSSSSSACGVNWGGSGTSGGAGLESSPADTSILVTASSPSQFNRSTFFARAVPQEQPQEQSSFASGSAGIGGDAPLARSSSRSPSTQTQIQTQRRPSLYTHPSSSSTLSSMFSMTSSTLSSLSFGISKSKSEKKKSKSREGKEKGKDKEKSLPKVGPKLALHGARTPVTSAVWWARRSTIHSSSSGGSSVDNTYDIRNNPPGLARTRTTAASKTRTGTRSKSTTTSMTTSMMTTTRRLEGEIALPKDLVPSFEFGGFSVKYALALLPFQAPGFELTPSVSSPFSPLSPFSPSHPSSPYPSSPILPSSTSSITGPSLTLTHEPLLLSPISIATLPYSTLASSSSPSLSPSSTSTSFPGVSPSPSPSPSSTSTLIPTPTPNLTPTPTATPRSRIPPDLDAHSQRTAHAERVRKPVVWGLFNQFVHGGGPGTVSVSASASASPSGSASTSPASSAVGRASTSTSAVSSPAGSAVGKSKSVSAK